VGQEEPVALVVAVEVQVSVVVAHWLVALVDQV
jgi:hypothetical protein